MAIPLNVINGVFRYDPLNPNNNLPIISADRSVSWSTSSGTLQPTVGTSTTLFPLNRTQNIIVSATDGVDNGVVTVSVSGTFPLQPNWGYDYEEDVKTIPSYGEDGSVTFRVKGKIFSMWSLGFESRDVDEWYAIRDFWRFHRKHIPFYYQDLGLTENVNGVETPILRLVTFDSTNKPKAAGPNRLSFSAVLREWW